MTSNPSLQVGGIDHVVLHVSDLDRSRRFYTELLGFDIAHEFPGHLFLRCGDQMVGLFTNDDPLHPRSELNHLALRLATGDYEHTKATLELPLVSWRVRSCCLGRRDGGQFVVDG